MERGELDSELAEEIRARVLGDGFMKIVQTVRRNGTTFRISMRPVLIGGERKSVVTEGEFLDAGKTVRIIHVNGSRIVVEPVSK